MVDPTTGSHGLPAPPTTPLPTTWLRATRRRSSTCATPPAPSAPTASRPSAAARRSGRTCPTSAGTTGAGSSRNRVNTAEEIGRVLNLTDDERAGLSSPDKFRVDITPYFLSLIDPDDPNDPIRRQVIPTDCEHEAFTAMMEDSLAEDRHSPVPGLVHRYPDRVLMLVTTQCASYCRYCTRSRIVGDADAELQPPRPRGPARLPAPHARRSATCSSPAATA